MNVQSCTCSTEHCDTPHLAQFHGDLNIRGAESVLNRTRIRGVLRDHVFQTIAYFEQPGGKLQSSGRFDGPKVDETIAPAVSFDYAPACRFAARIDSYNTHL